MDGVELIAAERERQVAEEGWTAEHDAGHGNGGLAYAAACYAKAGALIAAEIDRLQRVEHSTEGEGQ